ncbi:hypothetical protein MTO96_023852 [Rhipicephalus appendiculatus]
MIHSSSVFQNFQKENMWQTISISTVLVLMIGVTTCEDFDLGYFTFYYNYKGSCIINGREFENGSFVPTPDFFGCLAVLCLGSEKKLHVYGCPKAYCIDDAIDVPAFYNNTWTLCCEH